MKYEIFCDLDGVLVDFDKGYEKLTGKNIKNQFDTSYNFWKPINEAGEHFWYNLEWLIEGFSIWNKINKYNPTILSAPGRHYGSYVGKSKWLKKHLPNTKFILCKAQNKQKFSGQNRILIDDRYDNIEQWISRGGIGVYHIDIRNTLNHLEYLGL